MTEEKKPETLLDQILDRRTLFLFEIRVRIRKDGQGARVVTYATGTNAADAARAAVEQIRGLDVEVAEKIRPRDVHQVVSPSLIRAIMWPF